MGLVALNRSNFNVGDEVIGVIDTRSHVNPDWLDNTMIIKSVSNINGCCIVEHPYYGSSVWYFKNLLPVDILTKLEKIIYGIS